MIDFKIIKDETIREIHVAYDNSEQENRTKISNEICNIFSGYIVKIIQSGANPDKVDGPLDGLIIAHIVIK